MRKSIETRDTLLGGASCKSSLWTNGFTRKHASAKVSTVLTFVHLTVMGLSPSAVHTNFTWGSLMAALILLVLSFATILGGTLTVTLTMVWSG